MYVVQPACRTATAARTRDTFSDPFLTLTGVAAGGPEDPPITSP